LHRRYVRDSRIGDLVPKRDIVLYQRPHSWGELPPLLAALPAILASRRLMEEMLLIASAMASDRPTLRQQFVRRRPMNIDQRDSMVHAQKSIALGASILEYSPFNPRLLETFTQYFLAWQHREALIRASDLRDIVLQTTNRELLPELSTLWGRPALGVRVKVEGDLLVSEQKRCLRNSRPVHYRFLSSTGRVRPGSKRDRRRAVLGRSLAVNGGESQARSPFNRSTRSFHPFSLGLPSSRPGRQGPCASIFVF
jgi:hypothetical protein